MTDDLPYLRNLKNSGIYYLASNTNKPCFFLFIAVYLHKKYWNSISFNCYN